MSITRDALESVIFKTYDSSVIRYLQNSPIYPSVWLEYAEKKERRADLILTPHFRSSAAEVFKVLHGIAKKRELLANWELATNGETVAAKLTFKELINDVLPLTSWWLKTWDTDYENTKREPLREREWLSLVIGAILSAHNTARIKEINEQTKKTMRTLGKRYFNPERLNNERSADGILYSININRRAFISLHHSVPCTKADAGRRLFNIDGADINWAVVDSGIDAQHPAFRQIDPKTKKIFENAMMPEKERTSNNTRILATYDFTQFRKLISNLVSKPRATTLLSGLPTGDQQNKSLSESKKKDSVDSIIAALHDGRMLDWSVLGPLLRIPHNDSGAYRKPGHPHGTHVAGIIGAGLTEGSGGETVLTGMCPRINLFDFRVLDENGEGDEFNIIAALQFIRWINQYDGLSIHGVNLSMSLYHDVETYACGHTPVCVSANRLVEEGVVVVAAAGNQGQSIFQSDSGKPSQGFRTVNITDPGNAEDVITVGATHRNEPHRYGVSYFSSKGPTGDGRIKPDLVAPGEKIYSAVLDEGIDAMDGTSMAAPHVSGAAALIMSKHREMIGRPRRIKEILCKTATDLGREKYFQGCGMVDVLRALQSV